MLRQSTLGQFFDKVQKKAKLNESQEVRPRHLPQVPEFFDEEELYSLEHVNESENSCEIHYNT